MKTYTVQSGDTLTTIARKALGDGKAWRLLAEQNRISNPSDIRVGQVLRLPIEEYRVQRGDTLSAIARKTLGDSSRWQELAQYNNIRNARELRVGMVLKIPPTATKPTAPPTAPPTVPPSAPIPAEPTAPEEPTAPTPPPPSQSAPPKPTAPKPTAPRPTSSQPATSYTVQNGDTLTGIARKTLGDGNRWREIARLNNISNPGVMRVGMVLKIPAQPNTSSSTAPVTPPPVSPAPIPTPPIPTPPKPPTIQANTYQVQRGDSLIHIAQKMLGDGNRWREIARLNNITNARDIRVGQVLTIPGAATNNASSTESPANVTTNQTIDVSTTPVYKTYRIQPGDSLIGIAQKTLGDGNRWREIAKLNSITNARDIRVGQVLKLPILVSEAPLPGTVQLPPPPAVPVASLTAGTLSKYQVQSGDTLSQIAQSNLGDRQRWTEIALLNSIDNPSNISVGQVLRLPDQGPGALAVVPVLNLGQGKIGQGKMIQKKQPSPGRSLVRFIQSQDDIIAEWVKGEQRDRETVGVRYRQGLFRRGRYKTREFVDRERALLNQSRLSDSEINVIAAVSENEGYLDAINTWDSQYLSFGLFQWTAGSPNRPGELAELLTQLKQRYPEEFSHYFGQFGLDVDGTDGIRGWLSLNGQRLTNDDQKSLLRLPIWAYRFAIAGSDPIVQALQIIHAITRLDKFYFVRQSSLEGYSLSRLITSELGVALLLDNHVNRPAFVAPGLAEALWQLGLSPQELAQADTAEERRVIERYLIIRETFGSRPMSHARHRAGRIKRQMSDGRLSAERGSFFSNRPQRRA